MGEYETVKRDAPDDAATMSNAPSCKLLPCIIVLSPNGKYLGEIVGYSGGGAEGLLAKLQALEQ